MEARQLSQHKLAKASGVNQSAICKYLNEGKGSNCLAVYEDSEIDTAEVERVVMAWAAEHQEPVYPTWEEWLQSIGIMENEGKIKELCQKQLLIDNIPAHAIPTRKVLEPIPADIAEKLGIQPKEG